VAKVHVQSTDYDRTLMSAYSNLAGLFPPAQSQVWNNDLPWQPIPVHTEPIDSDIVSELHHNSKSHAEPLRNSNKSIFFDYRIACITTDNLTFIAPLTSTQVKKGIKPVLLCRMNACISCMLRIM